MKKILFGLMAIVALFANYSCSNDDVDVTRDLTIKVNMGNVLAGFDAETQNDLSSLKTGRSVRATILLYDANGVLVKGLYRTESSYKTSSFVLAGIPDGTYTLISATDVVESGQSTFWQFKNIKKLTTASISRIKNFDDTNLGIGILLGVSSQKITINNSNKDFVANPSPAGSLLRVEYHNIHAWSSVTDVTSLQLVSGKFSSSLNFDINGNYTKNYDSNSYYWMSKILLSTHTDDLNDDYYYYSYSFHLSGTKIPINFVIYYNYNNAEKYMFISDNNLYVDFGDGEQWTASVDLKTGDWGCIKTSSGQKMLGSTKPARPACGNVGDQTVSLSRIGE
jgi:hypothetical protein